MSRPVIFGHRGAAGAAPENTHAAFRQAFTGGADGVELDVRCCASGEVVVIHDATINRTSNGVGRVAQLPLPALRAFDFGVRFDPQFAGETIPTLEEVFTRLPAGKLVNVEIKNEVCRSQGEERAVARLIARFGLYEQCLVSSFNPLCCGACNKPIRASHWRTCTGRSRRGTCGGFRSPAYCACTPSTRIIP